MQSGLTIMADDLLFEDDEISVMDCLPVASQPIVVATENYNFVDDDAQAELHSLGDGVRSAEEKIILQILNEARGNRKATAEKLGISPRTLRYKIARMKESGVLLPC
jgi:two-component system response regulator FlrC